jgi:peptidoglycan/LPS O-acetylase OafA/YrhL
LTGYQGYRPEIDGLRGVAVLAVVLFHLDIAAFRGGFVGVDVFFVISGYLITGLVRRDVIKHSFRYREFFVRRVRRLAPALLTLTAVTCVVAWFVLLPSDAVKFGDSVVAQPLALQNMHFLAEGEYFAGSDRKLLLHTWSLGVEEQFYLVWPFAIIALSRMRRTSGLFALTVILLLSFGLNLLFPLVSPKASFFLFPARAWELGAGGMLALAEEGRTTRAALARWRLPLVLTGAALLLFSFAWISEDMMFPGWVAGLPVLATVCLIASTSAADSFVKRVLRAPSLVFVGAISYSLYLWHWPVIVCARYLRVEPHGLVVGPVLVALSVVLATLSYRFVEQPVRKGQVLPTTRSLLYAVMSVGALLIAFGIVVRQTDGLAFRYSGTARVMLTASFDADGSERCGLVFRTLHPRSQVCRVNGVLGDGGVLVWGNSHAAMWIGTLADMGAERGVPVYLNARNCRATTDGTFCNDRVQRQVLKFVDQHGVGDVVLAGTWYGAYGIADEVFEAELAEVVRELEVRGVRVWLFIDVPRDTEFDPAVLYLANPANPTFGSISRSEHEGRQRQREAAYFARLVSERVQVIDPTDDLCPDGRCYGGRDRSWYRDHAHLTRTGTDLVAHRFGPIFEAQR